MLLIGGPVPVSPGFPIEAFGNDRLLAPIIHAPRKNYDTVSIKG